jgi:hypothetical protein
MAKQGEWTNPSVLALAGDADPIEAITKKARGVILSFIESGGIGPPFDPFDLARHLKVAVTPSADVRDARTVSVGGKLHVEFNPNRPRSRVRYSVSHELIHTLFPDCKEEIRYRAEHRGMRSDGWQLEMLCNIGASELLMPIGSFPELKNQNISIDNLLELRSAYEVSIEALLLRFIKLTKNQCVIFSASRIAPDRELYKIDYALSSSTFQQIRIPNGLVLPSNSAVKECTAIGFTNKGNEVWGRALQALRVECVGIPPYPGHTYPRVMGIVRPVKQALGHANRPVVLKGDATKPRGSGNRILAFVVNDKAARWGAGFGLVVRKKWQHVQDEFVSWVEEHPDDFLLGNIHLTQIEDNLMAAQLIGQHGYGDSPKPRIRYKALNECLEKLATVAKKEGASVHMPRIGSGQAGGHWPIIFEMIDDLLSKRGIEVVIYEPPKAQTKEEPQQPLLDFVGQA